MGFASVEIRGYCWPNGVGLEFNWGDGIYLELFVKFVPIKVRSEIR
jgi:hypothetical protein